jgi:hypothetical protein
VLACSLTNSSLDFLSLEVGLLISKLEFQLGWKDLKKAQEKMEDLK